MKLKSARNKVTVLASEFVSEFVSLTRIAKIMDFRDPKNAGHFYEVTSVNKCRRKGDRWKSLVKVKNRDYGCAKEIKNEV